MLNGFLRFSLAFLFIAATAASVFSQKIPGDKKLQPKEIRVNLLVTDQKGKPIDDVDPGSVKLFENGIELKIVKFEKNRSLNLGFLVDKGNFKKTQLERFIFTSNLFSEILKKDDQAFTVIPVDSEKKVAVAEWNAGKFSSPSFFTDSCGEGEIKDGDDSLFIAVDKLAKMHEDNASAISALFTLNLGEGQSAVHKKKEAESMLLERPFSLSTIAGPVRKADSPFQAEFYREVIKYEVAKLRAQYIVSYIPAAKPDSAETRKLTATIANGKSGEVRTAILVPIR